eukprot:1712986-Rhodomonas_salina.1
MDMGRSDRRRCRRDHTRSIIHSTPRNDLNKPSNDLRDLQPPRCSIAGILDAVETHAKVVVQRPAN